MTNQITDAIRQSQPIAPARQKLRQCIFFLARAIFSIALLWLVMRKISFVDLQERFATIDLVWLAIALGIMFGMTVVSSVRWRQICDVVDCKLRIAEAWRILMIATTLDQFVFNMSGDAFRIWWLRQRALSTTHAFCGTILDRVVGFLGLILVIIVGLPFLASIEHVGTLFLAPALLAAGGIGGAMAVIFFNSIPLPDFPLKTNLMLLSKMARRLFLQPRHAIAAMLPATCVHICAALAVAAVGAAVGVGVSLGWYLLVTPTVMLVALLPISIGGWGVREGAMLIGLGLAGVSSVDALVISVLFGLCGTTIGVAGAIVWLFGLPKFHTSARLSTTRSQEN